MNDRKIIQISRLRFNFSLFQRFAGQLPSLPKLAGWFLTIGKKEYTDENFPKVSSFLLINEY